MTEIVFILAVLVILTLWIAGHTIYRWRTDVLTGRYYTTGSEPERADAEPATDEKAADGVSETAAEQRTAAHALLLGWNLDEAEPKAPSEITTAETGEVPPTAATTK